MLALRPLGYPYIVDCRQPHTADIDMFRAVLKRGNALPAGDLHLFPRLARDPQLNHLAGGLMCGSVFYLMPSPLWGLTSPQP
jgi:hypothetical protein